MSIAHASLARSGSASPDPAQSQPVSPGAVGTTLAVVMGLAVVLLALQRRQRPTAPSGPLAVGDTAHVPQFSKDWFSRNIPVWNQVYGPLKGRPDLRFLEIGVFEGRSTVWLLGHVLTHPTARVVCVDTFEGSMEHADAQNRAHVPEAIIGTLYERFKHNVGPDWHRVEAHRGNSQEILRRFEPGAYDSVYVDGSHKACDVLEDAVLSFRLLKPGGFMFFDDYLWPTYQGTLNHPKPGIDAFLSVFEGQYREVHRDYQVVIQKL